MTMKRLLTTFSALILLCGSAFAQDNSTALPFIRSTRNPAAAGVAGAGSTSLSLGTAWSTFANPALLPLGDKLLEGSFAYGTTPMGDEKITNLGFGASVDLGRFAFSFGFSDDMSPEMEILGALGQPEGSFNPEDFLIGVGVGYQVADAFTVGLNIRYAKSALTPDNDLTAVNGDVMAQYVGGAWNVAAGIAGLGTSVKDAAGNSYSLPASARLAGNYVLTAGTQHAVEGMADFDYFFSGNLSAAVGIQYGWKDMIFARAGYRYSTEKDAFNAAPVPSHLALGLGFQCYGVRFDAAYLTANDAIGGAMTFGLGYSF